MNDTSRTVIAPEEAPGAADAAPGPATEKEAVAIALTGSNETAEDGKIIRLRKPDVLAQYRIVQAVGPEVSANQAYMQMINPLIYVSEINGDPVPMPRSHLEVEALIIRLGEHGMNTVIGWYMRNIYLPSQTAMNDAVRQSQEAQERAALKN